MNPESFPGAGGRPPAGPPPEPQTVPSPAPPTPPLGRVFIGGCERSGTTFLAAELSKWTGLTFLPESYFLLEVLAAQATRPDSKLRDSILDHWRFRAWNLPRQELRAQLEATLGAQECMDELARRYTRSLGGEEFLGWIEHTPLNLANVSLLDRSFTGHRYINVLRDGRAVASSILRSNFGPTTIRSAAAWWQAQILPGLLAEWADPTRVLTVRYEDLLRRPDWSRERILHFLQDDARGSGNVPIRVDPLFDKSHRLVGRPADVSRLDAWKKALKPRQVQAFESIAGGVLQSLGYELQAEPEQGSSRAAAYFDRIADSWVQLCWQFPARVLGRWAADFRRLSRRGSSRQGGES